jgi:hypothetical protein
MKKHIGLLLLFILLFNTAGVPAHKFYVGLFQIKFAPEKKMLQITSRVFVDDLNNAIEQRYKTKAFLGEPSESEKDMELLKRYFQDNLTVVIDGKNHPLYFHSKEMENNVVITYFSIKNIGSLKKLTVANKLLFDFVTEQQNILQTNVNGKKGSYLLTIDNPEAKIEL